MFNFRTLVLLLFLNLFLTPPVTCLTVRTKEELYVDLENLSYSSQQYKTNYAFVEKNIFTYKDLFFKRNPDGEKYYSKFGSSSNLRFRIDYPYDKANSIDQSVRFFKEFFLQDDYVQGVNNKKTFLQNPDSRDYINLLENCYFKRKSVYKNRLKMAKETMFKLHRVLFEQSVIEEYFKELFSFMYQIGRGLLFTLEKRHYSTTVNVDSIMYTNLRGFNVYKIIHTLGYR